MEIVIIAISCLLIGALAGALIVTHPIAAKRAVTIPSGDIDLIKAQLAALEAKVSSPPVAIPNVIVTAPPAAPKVT
jgi:hypothetical protein